MSRDLPIGWTSFALKHIGGVSGGKTPSKANFDFWSSPDVPWVSPKDMKKDLLEGSEDRISQIAVDEAGMTLYPAGAVLMVTRSGILQHTFPVALARIELTVNQDIKVVRPIEGINPEFLFYLLKNLGGEILSACSKDGTTVQSIDSEKLEIFPLPLPPTAEQIRIAQKLDELLAQVDTLKARIDAIPTLLKRFRQSVLAAAVAGRLTEEWRAENLTCSLRAQISSLITDKNTSSYGNSIPVTWALKNAGDICEFITKGTTPSKEKMSAGLGEVPFIKVYNLTFTGALDFSIDPTFVDVNTHSIDLKRSIVKPGDVLMNIVGPPLGKVSIVPATYPEWNINQAIARFRANDGISSKYLALCLRTESVLAHAISCAKATAGQFNLTLEICRELPIPVPPVAEQTEIVRRVDQLFAFADQLEAKVISAQSRINHLTQSILAKAFRGELVPQDPNDEAASMLLERIKAQRAAAPKAKRGRKASA
ncbi:restriction endonuclease subunit S [Pseudomonas fluorescens]|uniref:restriction endonuclease subunit S n=1 Tax=Pseudomonas fluorescens TaxID=294 RepID=UPI0009B9EE77|nr:restriction endonuclease subunit S [Pseudomonas fluorescens]